MRTLAQMVPSAIGMLVAAVAVHYAGAIATALEAVGL